MSAGIKNKKEHVIPACLPTKAGFRSFVRNTGISYQTKKILKKLDCCKKSHINTHQKIYLIIILKSKTISLHIYIGAAQ
jgi:hypothetical protein